MAHHSFAGVAELADALDLGSSASRRGGSTPFTRTNQLHEHRWVLFFLLFLLGLVEATLVLPLM